MCTSPIFIKNPKFRNLPVKTLRKYIQVPCGTCDECLRRRASDLYIRTQFEYKKILRQGGVGFMCCLTYGIDLCPTLSIDGKKYKVFNKKDVIDFMKRLRVNLDRYFQKEYGSNAPDFKYVVTSEFGKSSYGSKLPHYHLIFLFEKPITLRAFRLNYVKSLVNHKTGKRYFGKIYQCDLLDPAKGGIKYSCKYVLKDLMFTSTRLEINKIIKHKIDEINQKFKIIPDPQTWFDEFHNKCVRQNKAYQKAVSENCLPFRHMLQFFMCSNDLGLSALFDRYGKNLIELPVLNVNGYSFATPKIIKEKIATAFGDYSRIQYAKNVFLENFKNACSFLINQHKITSSDTNILFDFVQKYTMFEGGFLHLILPNGVKERLFDNFDYPDNDDVLNEHSFFMDNDFYTLREDVLNVIHLYNSPSMLKVRASIARDKTNKEEYMNKTKKLNKGIW